MAARHIALFFWSAVILLSLSIHGHGQIQHDFKNKVGGNMFTRLAVAAAVTHTADPAIHRGKRFVFFAGKALNAMVHRTSADSHVGSLTVLADMPDHVLSHDIPQSLLTSFSRRAESLHGEAPNQA
ncbi:MAG TPA: hypothetical protein VF458_14375 [Ktedonobacteraceae bacterium]